LLLLLLLLFFVVIFVVSISFLFAAQAHVALQAVLKTLFVSYGFCGWVGIFVTHHSIT